MTQLYAAARMKRKVTAEYEGSETIVQCDIKRKANFSDQPTLEAFVEGSAQRLHAIPQVRLIKALTGASDQSMEQFPDQLTSHLSELPYTQSSTLLSLWGLDAGTLSCSQPQRSV